MERESKVEERSISWGMSSLPAAQNNLLNVTTCFSRRLFHSCPPEVKRGDSGLSDVAGADIFPGKQQKNISKKKSFKENFLATTERRK